MKYKFDLLVMGEVSDSIVLEDKEQTIRTIIKFRDCTDFAFKFYINDELIPQNKINSVLGITNDMIWKHRTKIM